jgi:hypothetical protein
MKILHAQYAPSDIRVHMTAGETLVLFHNDERDLVEQLMLGLIATLEDDEQETRTALMAVYEQVRAPDIKEIN